MNNKNKEKKKRKPAQSLTKIKFPACAELCSMIELLGAGECESVCPDKFIEEVKQDEIRTK